MKISIFGLGYVGVVSAACLARNGHQVIGVDFNQAKVDLINGGHTPIIEKDIGPLIEKSAKEGIIRATTDANEAVEKSEIIMICVGTPSQPNGNLDLTYVKRVSEEIGAAIKNISKFALVVVRSTILPGSMRGVVIPTLEKRSGKKAGIDFGVCNNPEFLREGTAVYDYYHPPKTVIGEMETRSGDLLATLYEQIDAPTIRTDLETAEMVKYVDNVWHALKVGFANEIGNICKELEIDAHKVMDIFCQDTKLNISTSYLKPGFAFGGSCLPKDVRALLYKGRQLDLELPILNNILASNNCQIERGLKMIMEKGNKKIGVLGFSFKAGTDDLRESPMVEVIERLLGKGYDIRLYDQNVNLANLVGANRDYILNHIPHISKLMAVNMDDVVAHAKTLVIGHRDPEFKSVLDKIKDGQIIIDFARIINTQNKNNDYYGICW